MVFLKEFLEKVDFEKKPQQMTKSHAKLPSRQRVKALIMMQLMKFCDIYLDTG